MVLQHGPYKITKKLMERLHFYINIAIVYV